MPRHRRRAGGAGWLARVAGDLPLPERVDLSDRLRLSGFRTFILRGNVVDLAIGIVIGAAFTAVVNGFVSDFLTPLITIPFKSVGGGDITRHYWTVAGVHMRWGDFVNRLLALVLDGVAIYYLVVIPVNELMARFRTEPDPSSLKKTCPECKSSIPYDATRCAFCTVEQPAAAAS